MTKLTDTQLVLLSTAAQNERGSLLPLATSLTASRPAIDKSIASLIKRSFAEEGEVTDANIAWRNDGDIHFGVRITDAGRKAIGLTEESVPAVTPAAAPEVAVEKKQTKAALVVALLQREQGATLDELVAATGWLPHTTRAAMTGLRKKGHDIVKGKRGDITCYSIAVAA